MTEKDKDRASELADDHVEWLINFMVPIIRAFAIEEFKHGYKHGFEDGKREGK